MSLGRAWFHDMDNKLAQASNAGFEGIEVFYEDLEYLAKSRTLSDSGAIPDETALLAAARQIRKLCDTYNLVVIGLQPFLFYEGLMDRDQHDRLISKLKVWFKLVKILGTDLIQIPSNFLQSGITGDMDVIVNDMIEVADLGLAEDPPVRFAYEALAWGTHIDTWEAQWEVVSRVDRTNFGCCLDTFNLAGRVWADPAAASGKTDNADAVLEDSLRRLVKTIDVAKVFYVQVVDAERMQTPLVEGHAFYAENQPARMSWSRNARLFMYEQDRGGYLPVDRVAHAFIHGLGYKGWISMELFSRTMADTGPDVPKEHAKRGFESWKRLCEELKLV
jgi:4-hydroxyphenylpyruvate dioxygenase